MRQTRKHTRLPYEHDSYCQRAVKLADKYPHHRSHKFIILSRSQYPKRYQTIMSFSFPTNERAYFALLDYFDHGGSSTVKIAKYLVSNSSIEFVIKRQYCFDKKAAEFRKNMLYQSEKIWWKLYHPNSPVPSPTLLSKKVSHRGNGKTVYDLYVVEPRAPGKNLIYLINNEPLTYKERINIAINIIDEVNRLHAEGYAHCDIKPDNIYADRATGKVTLLGFDCISKHNTRFWKGTLSYSSPETLTGMQPHNRASDTFSVGKTIIELFNGYAAVLLEPRQKSFLGDDEMLTLCKNLTNDDSAKRPLLIQAKNIFQKKLRKLEAEAARGERLETTTNYNFLTTGAQLFRIIRTERSFPPTPGNQEMRSKHRLGQ